MADIVPNVGDEEMDELGEEYYVEPADVIIHTPEHPFCDDMTCPCHEDQDNIQDLGQAVQDGLATSSDADNIYRGRTV